MTRRNLSLAIFSTLAFTLIFAQPFVFAAAKRPKAVKEHGGTALAVKEHAGKEHGGTQVAVKEHAGQEHAGTPLAVA